MTVVNILQELQAICADIQISGVHTYRIREVMYTVTPSSAPSQASDTKKDLHSALAQHIAQQLYDQYYIRDSKYVRSSASFVHQTAENIKLNCVSSDLTAALIQANATKDAWDKGWKIYQISSNGKIFVQKADRSRAAVAGAYASDIMKVHGAQIGDLVSLRIYPANGELQAAFFHSFGSHLADQFDDYSAVRLYFNIDSEVASDLLMELSSQLNNYYVPFHFKTLVDPRQYGRADAAVLYIARRYYHFVVSLFTHLPTLLGTGLHDPVPMFCQRIMRGVGVAEDPGTGESFGMHRCRMVAEGLVSAWEDGLKTVDARLSAIKKSFEANNLNVEKPYLNPFSHDIFSAVLATNKVTASDTDFAAVATELL